MKVAYRRMSGAIGLSDQEKGTRGVWLEKRRAFLNVLRERGHEVFITSRLTKSSMGLIDQLRLEDCCPDLLVLEFGSSNARFYGKDLEETKRQLALHRGQVVFLCDDPDLPFSWKTISRGEHSRWSVWSNAKYRLPLSGQPEEIETYDFPFASLLTPLPPRGVYANVLTYIGRAKGRERVFRELLVRDVKLEVCGREVEWETLGVFPVEAPEQALRSEFYASRAGCLGLADAKHKRLGWRTGRAYHAIYAGTPSVVEADHSALTECFDSFRTSNDLKLKFQSWLDPSVRSAVVLDQQRRANMDRAIAEETLKEFGL